MPSFQKEQFGKYLLLDKIGVGGMAEVYIGKMTGDEGFEKLLVIKKILPHLTTEDELVRSFIDEAKIAALLQHENIIHIYDFGNIEDFYFIAMEFLLGKDLQLVIKKSSEKELQIGLENILYITSKICEGLDYAHKLKNLHGEALNIVHRDISPQNIFVTYDGHVKIIDFGIAKTAAQSTKTQVGLVKGKLAYMSPEQVGSQVIDHRSDIFSVGIILYEMVTGKRMFEGETLEIFSRVIQADFEPPENIVADIPPKLIDILHKSLAKDPDQRYTSCSEMLTDIEDCLYYLSLRPSARKMSRFMTSLFEREFHDEKTNIIEAMKVTEPEKQAADEAIPVENVKFEKTIVLETNYEDSAFLTEGDFKQGKEQTTKILPKEKLFQKKMETRVGKKVWAVIIALFIISILGTVGYLAKDKDKITKTIAADNHIESNTLAKDKEKLTNAVRSENHITSNRLAEDKDKLVPPIKPDDFIKSNTSEDIEKFLLLAEESLAAYRLTTPPETSAYHYYSEVLKRDPENPEAKQGMEEIANRYAFLAEKQMKNFKYEKANEYIEKGLTVSPNHSKLLSLKADASENLPTKVFKSFKSHF